MRRCGHLAGKGCKTLNSKLITGTAQRAVKEGGASCRLAALAACPLHAEHPLPASPTCWSCGPPGPVGRCGSAGVLLEAVLSLSCWQE
ncbi:Protocadherin-19 [Manis javanica]|nr:Protocadherin-19 [Manis javanica]